MADQSNIQNLIQTLAGTHTAGQENLPSGVNNGSPNTIYNSSPNIPIAGPNGQWYMPGYSNAASFDFGQGSGGGNILSILPVFNGSGVLPPNPWNPTTGGGGGGGTGGTTGGGTGGTGGGTTTPQVPTGGVLGSPLGGGFGTYVPNTGTTSGGWAGTSSSAGTNSNLNWQQLIDMAGDAIGLPGNWYLNGTGNWDTSNIIASTLSTITGLPISSVANAIGKYGAEHGWSENNLFVDHYMDNVRNDLANLQNQLNAKGEKMVSDGITKSANDAMKKTFGIDPQAQAFQQLVENVTNTYKSSGVGGLYNKGFTASQANQIAHALGGASIFSPSSIAASHSPYFSVIEGDAAREMFAGMRNQPHLQTGADEFGHVYAQ